MNFSEQTIEEILIEHIEKVQTTGQDVYLGVATKRLAMKMSQALDALYEQGVEAAEQVIITVSTLH